MKTRDKALQLRDELKIKNDFESNKIDTSLPIIPAYKGNAEIKLIVIGQDPTVKEESSRKKITCTLNLDKSNALKRYILDICSGLKITVDNVYATNLFKYFYTIRPSQTMEVLISHLEPNLDLLKEELKEFNNIPVITLGEPVLQLLTDLNEKVHDYWDFDQKTKSTNGMFQFSKANDNKLQRDFYPFPHQPSIRKAFYKNNITNYIKFMMKNN